MPLLEPDQRTRAWLDARLNRVTASLAAACLGLDPWNSRQKAWRMIRGVEPDRANRHTRWGQEFEELARQDYEAQTGDLVAPTGFWVHPDLDWLGASPDGLVGAEGLVEIKCPTALPGGVPVHHRIQMLVQLAVTGRAWCDYHVWTAAGSFTRRVFPAGTAALLARLEAFHRTYVLAGEPPPRKARKRQTKEAA